MGVCSLGVMFSKKDVNSLVAQKYYACIDLKSFYASVECVDRGLDPLTAKLVVADKGRTEKTICLAVSPALKALGVKNRCRLFEIPKSLSFEIAKPRMKRYMKVSSEIYAVYLQYMSEQDIHVYSIDECFIDITPYLSLYSMEPLPFARMIKSKVTEKTKIPATAGVGTNLFLAKVALDVTAKHIEDGVGFLDEEAFKQTIWFHRPITDIWSIGYGIARRLRKYGVSDLAGVAAMKEETLYKEFGVNAEYLIDHAWGQEPCTIEEIKTYVPKGHSAAYGQVLACDYTFDEARIILREMVDSAVLDLVSKRLVAEGISLMVGYAQSKARWSAAEIFESGHGKRVVGKARFAGANGSRKLNRRTNSFVLLIKAFYSLFEEIVDPSLFVKRINLSFNGLLPEKYATVTLFDDVESLEQEHSRQKAIIAVREKFGKNAMLKGTSLKEKATARERNEQVGGHHA